MKVSCVFRGDWIKFQPQTVSLFVCQFVFYVSPKLKQCIASSHHFSERPD